MWAVDTGSLNLAPLPRSAFCLFLKTHVRTTCSMTPSREERISRFLSCRGLASPNPASTAGWQNRPVALLLKPPEPPARVLLFPLKTGLRPDAFGMRALAECPGPVAPLSRIPHTIPCNQLQLPVCYLPPHRTGTLGDGVAPLRSSWNPGSWVGAQ